MIAIRTAQEGGLELGIQEDAFVVDLAQEVTVPGVRLASAVARLLRQHVTDSLKLGLGDKLTKLPVTHITSSARDGCPTLQDLANRGYQTWYLELRFSTKPEHSIDELAIEPVGIALDAIDYGQGIKRDHILTTKRLVTQTNHMLRLNSVRIDAGVFRRVLVALKDEAIEQPYAANPRPGPRTSGFQHGIEDYEFVSFDHVVEGTRLFCSCARLAHEGMLAEAQEKAGTYTAGSWPHQVVRLLTDAQYADGICHLCVAREFGASRAAEMYGDDLEAFLDVYINQLKRCNSLDLRTARAEVQQRLGLSRWLKEAEMYKIVKALFPSHLVFREASPPWLGRQRLDVYLPQIRLALEYQGEQHFAAVGAFGGKEALARTIERDALKRKLCETNEVDLVYVNYDEPMTAGRLRNRLRRYLKS